MAQLPARRGGQNVNVSPSRELEDIYDRMGQLMSFPFGAPGPFRLADLPWTPAADVSETEDAYVVHVELPGVRKDQVDVQLQERELIVTGEITETEKGRLLRRRQRKAGEFEFRTFLPGDVSPDRVTARLSDGVLTVTVPKAEAAKPRRIEIAG